MSLAAARLAPPPPSLLVDGYLDACFARLDRVVRSAPLPEPVLRHPAGAARIVDAVVRTLAGLAAGTAAGIVLQRVRRTFGRATADACARAAAAASVPRLTPPPFAVGDETPVRSIGEELRAALRRELTVSLAAASVVLDAMVRVLDDESAVQRMLVVLAADDLEPPGYAAQLTAGWRCVVDVLERGELSRQNAALWEAFRRRYQREATEVAVTHEAVIAAGFMLRIG